MKYTFGDFTLDTELGELSQAGQVVQVEPRAFALLWHLLSNANRLVTKDELIAAIWGGRIVTDAAISTLVKTVRRTVGGDGKSQRLIRTVHGRGFRFVGSLSQSMPATTKTEDRRPVEKAPIQTTRPSIAVLPFRGVGDMQGWEAMADAVPAELISSLSRLKWLRVLARGSTFRFRDPVPDMAVIRTDLGATYCLAGNVEIMGRRVSITAELSDTRDGEVIWSEEFSGNIDDIHQIRTDLVRLICSGLELHVNIHETERARLRPPDSLDAWSLYHFGLHHMYRFTAKDNSIAAEYLAKSTHLDPGFARAFAARSFTAFQAAFVGYGNDRAVHVDNARRFAEKCLEIDRLDPFGNFNFGRSFWLNGDHDSGQAYLERSIGLSPSFAHGLYARSHADMIAGQGARAIESAKDAIALSPLDPFLYAMYQAKALGHLHLGEKDQACRDTDTGAREPGAHYIVTAIASAVNMVSGRERQAQYWRDKTLTRRPDASIAQFFAAIPLRDPGVKTDIHRALTELGFPEH